MVTDIPQLTMVQITVVLMIQRHKISAYQVETGNWISPQAYK